MSVTLDWRRLGLSTSVALILALLHTAASGEDLQVARMLGQQQTDSLGFTWDIQHGGMVIDGTYDCFDNAGVLQVGGAHFQATTQAMQNTRTGELVFDGQAGVVPVQRRVLLSTDASALRYVDVFTGGSAPSTIQVAYSHNLGSNCQQIVDSDGQPWLGGALERRSGLVAIQRAGQRPSVVFVLSGRRSRLEQTVQVQNNRSITTQLQLELPAGQQRAVVLTIAQRRLQGSAPAKEELQAMFKPFTSRPWLRDVPRDLRQHIVNFARGSSETGLLDRVNNLAAAFDIARGEGDVLVRGGKSLKGALSCGALEVEGAFGVATVDPGEILMVEGTTSFGRQQRLHLRGGEVLAGDISGSDLQFSGGSGVQITLDFDTVSYAFLHTRPGDGQVERETLFVVTPRGDRLASLAWPGSPPAQLSGATPWGSFTTGLDAVAGLTPAEDPYPHLRLRMLDGTDLPLNVTSPLTVVCARFGEVTIGATEVAAILRASPLPRADEGDEGAGTDEGAEAEGAVEGGSEDGSEDEGTADADGDAPEETEPPRTSEPPGTTEPPVATEPPGSSRSARNRSRALRLLEQADELLAQGGKSREMGAKLLEMAVRRYPSLEQDAARLLAAHGPGATAPAATDDDDAPDLESDRVETSHCILLEEFRISGVLADALLHLHTAGTVTPLPVDAVTRMQRIEGDGVPRFEVELSDGSSISGHLRERVVQFRGAGKLWLLPVAHLTSVFHAPEEAPPAGADSPESSDDGEDE